MCTTCFTMSRVGKIYCNYFKYAIKHEREKNTGNLLKKVTYETNSFIAVFPNAILKKKKKKKLSQQLSDSNCRPIWSSNHTVIGITM